MAIEVMRELVNIEITNKLRDTRSHAFISARQVSWLMGHHMTAPSQTKSSGSLLSVHQLQLRVQPKLLLGSLLKNTFNCILT